MSTNKMFFSGIGGLDEIGMNAYVYAYGDNMQSSKKIIVDMGVNFPNVKEYPGTDVHYINPVILQRYIDTILGIVITHSHEDHMGALPHIQKTLNKTIPIFCSEFDIQVIKKKFDDHRNSCSKATFIYKWSPETPYEEMVTMLPHHPDTVVFVDITEFVRQQIPVRLGPMSLEIRFIPHSIPQTKAFVLRIPENKDIKPIFHTADYKIGCKECFCHPDAEQPNVDKDFLDAIRKEGVGLMIGDSTNAHVQNWSGTELEVEQSLVKNLEQRRFLEMIFVVSFGSNVERMVTVYNVARKLGRKVALAGRSPMEFMEAAEKVGLVRDLNIISLEEAASLPRKQVLVIISGTQLDHNSFASRLLYNQLRGGEIKLKKDDAIVFSSRAIPGNEERITAGQNEAIKRGAHVFDSYDFLVHTSGHSCKEDIKATISLINPEAYIPMHGDAIHRYRNKKIAESLGIKNVWMLSNKDIADITNPQDVKITEKIRDCSLLQSGKVVLNTQGQAIHERRHMDHGVIAICIIRDKNKKLYTAPIITIIGVMDNPEKLVEDIKNAIKRSFKKSYDDGSSKEIVNRVKALCRNTLGFIPTIKVHIE